MAAHTTFAGLKRLMSRASLRIGANGDVETVKPAEGEDEDGDAAPVDPADPADPAPVDPADPADPADPPKEGEDDDEDNDGTGDGGDAAGDASGTEAGAEPVGRSADFLAGQRHGATLTAGRFAAVLASPVARANLEMATDLLADTSMSPKAIIEHCDKYKGDNAARRLLDNTPKMDLGDGDGGGQKDGTEASTSRKSAVAGVNKSIARTAKNAGTPVRPSRRAAANRTPPAK